MLATIEDGVYIVEVPDLPGCVADGDTIEEAFKNLSEAMEAWIESRLSAGESVPEPRNSESYSGKFVLRLPKRLHQILAEQAQAEECSLNQYAVSLLSEAVGMHAESRQSSALEKCAKLLVEATNRLERLSDYSGLRVRDFQNSECLIPIQQQEGSQLEAAPSSLNRWLNDAQLNRREMAYEA